MPHPSNTEYARRIQAKLLGATFATLRDQLRVLAVIEAHLEMADERYLVGRKIAHELPNDEQCKVWEFTASKNGG